MNAELNTVKGVVEAVGTKFNGSIKVGGKFYSFRKGTKSEAKVGDTVTLILKPWEFEGKTGENVCEVQVDSVGTSLLAFVPKTQVKAVMTDLKTDWAAKDRSQLVGGRSHDAAELAKVAISTGTPMSKVLAAYEEALKGVLRIAEDLK